MQDEIAGVARPDDPMRADSGPSGEHGTQPVAAQDAGEPPPLPQHLMPAAPTLSGGLTTATGVAASLGPSPATSPSVSIVPMVPSAGGEPVVASSPAEHRSDEGSRRWLPWLAVGVSAILLVGLGAVALSFRASAQAQTERALAAESTLAATAADLATTKADLATTKTDLADSTTALAAESTRADGLDQRVSELTNEKAQVQDERNVAEEQSRLGAAAAAQMLECRDLLLDAMSAVFSGSSLYPNYSGMNARLDVAVPVCQAANSSVDAFIAATQ